MQNPRASNLLRRIGYGCGSIIATSVLVIGGAFLWRWLPDLIEAMNQTRTHNGPLAAHGRYDMAEYAIPLLALLPPRGAFTKGGLRFAAMPAFGHWYAISLRDTGEKIEGTAVTVEQPVSSLEWPDQGTLQYTGVTTTKFTLSRQAYSGLMEQLDSLADGYWGYRWRCLDGVEVAFERLRQERTISGMGNCADHYQQMSNAVLAALRPDLSLPYLQPGKGWYSYPSEAQKGRAAK